jgi:membrane protein YdbS with pleckstrin-like domain
MKPRLTTTIMLGLVIFAGFVIAVGLLGLLAWSIISGPLWWLVCFSVSVVLGMSFWIAHDVNAHFMKWKSDRDSREARCGKRP